MNESIKFTADDANGKYATDDTGVMVAVSRDYSDCLVAVVRGTDNKYVTAPLDDIEYVAAEES